MEVLSVSEFGSVRLDGEDVPLTLLGWLVVSVVKAVVMIGFVWLLLVVTWFAFS